MIARMSKLSLSNLIIVVVCILLHAGCENGQDDIEPIQGDLYLNEFMARNDSIMTDESGDYDDWVELYNSTDTVISLAGYYLTDDLADPTKFLFPDDIAIAGKQYLLIWCDRDTADGFLHADFKLSAAGEELGLSNPNGHIVDSIVFPEQSTDVSYGRYPDAGSSWFYFGDCDSCVTAECISNCLEQSTPTPGWSNIF